MMMNPLISLPVVSDQITENLRSLMNSKVKEILDTKSTARYVLWLRKMGYISGNEINVLEQSKFKEIELIDLERNGSLKYGERVRFKRNILCPKEIVTRMECAEHDYVDQASNLLVLNKISGVINPTELDEFIGNSISRLKDTSKFINKQLNEFVFPTSLNCETSKFKYCYGFGFVEDHLVIETYDTSIVDVSNIVTSHNCGYVTKQILFKTLSLASSVFNQFLTPQDYFSQGSSWILDSSYEEFQMIVDEYPEYSDINELKDLLEQDSDLKMNCEYLGSIEDEETLMNALARLEYGKSLDKLDWMRLPEDFYTDRERSIKSLLREIGNLTKTNDVEDEVHILCRSVLTYMEGNMKSIENGSNINVMGEENMPLAYSIFIKMDGKDYAESIANEQDHYHMECGITMCEGVSVDEIHKYEQRLKDMRTCLAFLQSLSNVNSSISKEL